uniref:DUF389 domain-containing protein n=1 Tax=uncultured Allisonella sp. TaxID=339338 RepID=UPI0025924F23|nr:DUF389 domain-containing protein [uncultured Allisonella sp.]
MIPWNNLFDLKGDAASIEVINQRIISDASIEGTNLIILVMAIMIACIGLNLNSVAVIIGAMLISPLMGGIVATGYGMATYDAPFIRKSLFKLSFQIGLAILSAYTYFLITPLTSPTDEMLARTTPTIWDVVVALCGGIAGAVGNTRKEKSNVIPGVAIATALMPPLCTAGYGLASGHHAFFLGALYLFFINAFFIALSSFLVFKLLNVPPHGNTAEAHFRKQRLILATLGLLITVPSIYLAQQTVKDTLREVQVKSFIQTDMNFEKTSVVSYSLKNDTLTIDLVGAVLTDEQIEQLKNDIIHYPRLEGITLSIIQGNKNLNTEDVQQLINARIEKQNAGDKEASYKLLASKYYPAYERTTADQEVTQTLNRQAPALFPQIQSIRCGTLLSLNHNNDAKDESFDYSCFLAEVTVSSPLKPYDAKRLHDWIQGQVNMPVILNIQTSNSPSEYYGNGIQW